MEVSVLPANTGALLHAFAIKSKSEIVNFFDFCDFVKKYAEKHVEENKEFVKFLGTTEVAVTAELDELANSNMVAVVTPTNNKKLIVVVSYFSIKYGKIYSNMQKNPAVPFPKFAELQKIIPKTLIPKEASNEFFTRIFENQNLKSLVTHCVLFPHEVTPILFPESVPVSLLREVATAKLRLYLKKDEHHDYFLKKLRSTNHGREITVQNFYRDFINNQRVVADYLENSTEYFYLLSQLCYFIRQDVTKLKDSTPEDENVLQAVLITEFEMSFFKTKLAAKQKKEAALRDLEANFMQMPFFFSMDAVYKFTDKQGNLLYGLYDENDLKQFLSSKTKTPPTGEMPELMTFDTDSGAKYFVHKSNVFRLILRLSQESRNTIDRFLTEEWNTKLYNFEKVPESTDQKLFENKLHEEVREHSALLHTMLTSSLLPVLHYELIGNDKEDVQIFSDGQLLPYSTILMLDKKAILSNAKATLPFWYTIPIISSIAALFAKKDKKAPSKSVVEESSRSGDRREDQIVSAAKEMITRMVPEGSTVDRELDSYENLWNKMISPNVHKQLTQDVNSLIRDYLRKIGRNLSASSVTPDRLDTIADSIARYPTLQKIGESQALKMYTKLYVLRLLSNFR